VPHALSLWLERLRILNPISMKKFILFLAFSFFLSTFISAQTSQPAPQPAPVPEQTAPSAQTSPQQPSTPVPPEKGAQQPASPENQAKQPEKEHKITAEEAVELFKSVDEIFAFASKDTHLPIKHSVKKAMVSRDQVEKYIGDKFKDDVDRIRFERSELVLKKFGLLPRKFNLHDFLIKLLGEQVAGYYDEKTKTVNLLDWVEMDSQKPVMAHELTHSLQDQSFDLEKMMKKDEEIERRGPENYNALIKIDEESTARTAVVEGQAMIVLLDYVLAPAGRSVQDSPKFVDFMMTEMQKNEGKDLLETAPLLLREELLFPYGAGTKFIEKLLLSGGKDLAFTKVMQRLPVTSREILEPQEYLDGEVVPPLLLPDMGFLKSSFEPFDAGAVGQLDVSILLKQYAEDAVADRLSPEWRGGSYYAVGRKGVKPADPNSSAYIGLLYVSKWSSEKAAQEFAKIYASALPGRYDKLEHLAAQSVPGREKYSSADGPIYIQQNGPLVIAVESFDDPVAERLIQAVLAQQGKEPALREKGPRPK
jgi:hypothetical protein